MLTLPDEYNTLWAIFRPQFSKRIWPLARLLPVLLKTFLPHGPVVRPGDCPHHASADGPILLGDPAGSSLPGSGSAAHPASSLVRQG